jgi:Pao retrotransposon peptidase
MEKGKFTLRKWVSNHPDVLESLDPDHKLSTLVDFGNEDSIKTLGIKWNPTTDNFLFKISMNESSNTKRQVLSEIARIYDPLVWLEPIIITAKLLMQDIWKEELSWDKKTTTPLPV